MNSRQFEFSLSDFFLRRRKSPDVAQGEWEGGCHLCVPLSLLLSSLVMFITPDCCVVCYVNEIPRGNLISALGRYQLLCITSRQTKQKVPLVPWWVKRPAAAIGLPAQIKSFFFLLI